MRRSFRRQKTEPMVELEPIAQPVAKMASNRKASANVASPVGKTALILQTKEGSAGSSVLAKMSRFVVVLALMGVLYLQYHKINTNAEFPDFSHCERVLSSKNSLLNKNSELNYSALSGECYFSDDFYAAKNLFVQSAKNANAEVLYMLVTDTLGTDVAIFKGSNKRFLLHVSGVHGPEGFHGSAAQVAILQYLSVNKIYDDVRLQEEAVRGGESASMRDEAMLLPTIVLVHALNPYGMAHNRRFTEDNIDLNRNFLRDEEFIAAGKRDPNIAGYVDVDSFINPKAMPTKSIFLNDIHGYFVTIYAVVNFGIEKIKKAMVTGTYSKKEGLYYGGKARTRNVQNLIDIVTDKLQIPTTSEKIVVIDVHSGLGPSGFDTLAILSANNDTADQLELLEKYFPKEYDSQGACVGGFKESALGGDGEGTSKRPSAMSGYELTIGTLTENFCRNFLAPHLQDGSKRVCITQEFGTVDKIFVGKAMRDENYAYHFGTAEEREIYGRRVKDCFYVNTIKWKRQVLRRALKLFVEGLSFLQL